MLKYTTSSFIEKIKQKDKERNINYDYSKFSYEGTYKKSTIICKIHGEFKMTPNNRLNGQDCYHCGKIKNIKPLYLRKLNFLERVKHTKYSYEDFIFINSNTPSIVICPTHGKFNMAPKHLQLGHGCKECSYLLSGHRKEDWIKRVKGRKGIFYILECSNNNEKFYKIGITSLSVKERYRKKGYMPYIYTIVKEIVSEDLEFIWNLESKFKKYYREYKYKPLFPFPGSVYECFNKIENYEKIINNWGEAK